MRVQRNQWLLDKHRWESYEEAGVHEGENVHLQQLDSNSHFVGTRFRLYQEGNGEGPYPLSLTMEGAEMSFHGGEFMVAGFVEITSDPNNQHLENTGKFRKELWIVLEA